FSPASAPVGAAVTITGANLTGTAVVTFGGNVSTSPTSVSATQVKTSVPDGAMTGPIRVTNDAGTATNGGAFRLPPKTTRVRPPWRRSPGPYAALFRAVQPGVGAGRRGRHDHRHQPDRDDGRDIRGQRLDLADVGGRKPGEDQRAQWRRDGAHQREERGGH